MSLLVQKKHKIGNDSGLVSVIARIENNQIIPVVDDEFSPENTVFITNSYTQSIDSRFSDDDLFILDNYRKNPEYGMSPEKTEYIWSFSKYVSMLKHAEDYGFIPLVEGSEEPTPDSPYFNLPNSGKIYIKYNDYIYGPFDVTHTENGPILSPAKTTILNRPNNEFILRISVNQLHKSNAFYKVNDRIDRVIVNTKNIAPQIYDFIDFISTSNLLDWIISTELKIRKVKDSQFKNCKDALNTISKNFPKGFLENVYRERISRLDEILTKGVSLSRKWDETIHAALKKNPQIYDEYIAKNKEILLKGKLDILDKEIADAKKKRIEEIDALQKKVNQLTDEISRLEFERKENIALQNKIEDLDDGIKNRNAEIDELDKAIKELREKYTLSKSIAKLQEQELVLRYQHEDIKGKIDALRRDDVPFAVGKIRTYLDILDGKLRQDETAQAFDRPPHSFAPPATAKDYIASIQDRLSKKGRNFSFNDIANLLILLYCNFITVFAGRPGTGKTSLACYLAEVLGLEINKNFIKIPVSRGWTSQKDLIGFFNPLNDKFQESRTGLYSFLAAMSETDSLKAEPLSIILLDEANLSPIEHYWADFLSMCDGQGDKYINLTSKSLKIGQNIRFIATINHDNTTERLSPRLLDRVAVVILPQVDNSTISSDDPEDEEKHLPIPYENFKNIFQIESRDTIIDDIISKITESMSDDSVMYSCISPRKYTAIKKYCDIACNLFDNNEYIDYAIAQFYLPTLEGFGEEFGSKLNDLKQKLDSYSRSKAILEYIISQGQKFHHSYSYFG